MNLQKIKVSIILPTYNVEKHLPRCIESILNQTLSDFELLIIIDGSPDNSKLIAHEYARTDSRIRVFEKENGGVSNARNYGLEKAEGQFIYFVDADDWIDPNLLKTSVCFIEEEDLDFIVLGYFHDIQNMRGETVSSRVVSPGNNFFRKSNGTLAIDAQLLSLLGFVWNKLYRASFLELNNIKFDKEVDFGEDILFNTQVYINSSVIRTIDAQYYHYMVSSSASLSKTFNPNAFELYKRRGDALEKFLINWKVVSSERVLAYSMLQGVRYCLHSAFAFTNSMSFKDKVVYIQNIISDDFCRKWINFYKCEGAKDFLFKRLIKSRQAFLLTLLAKVAKNKM